MVFVDNKYTDSVTFKMGNSELITSLDELDSVLDEWAGFIDACAYECRFEQAPEVIRLKFCSSAGRQSPFCIILRNALKKIECIAPFVIIKGNFRLTFSTLQLASPKARILKLLGNGLVFSANADKDMCIKRVFDVLIKQKSEYNYIYFDNLLAINPLWKSFQGNLFSRKELQLAIASPKIEKTYFTELPENIDVWRANFSKKQRYNMKRTTRLMKEAFDGDIQLECVRSPSQVEAFFDHLDILFNKTWQAKTMGHRKRNIASHKDYFKAIADKGWLRSYMLYAQGQPVAFLLGYQYRKVFEYVEIGYDSDLANYSPGSVLNNLLFEDLFFYEQPQNIDFGFGDNQYKRVFCNVSHDSCSAYLTYPGYWRSLVGLQLTLNKAYRGIYAMVMQSGLDKPIRRMFKRK